MAAPSRTASEAIKTAILLFVFDINFDNTYALLGSICFESPPQNYVGMALSCQK